MKNKKPIILAIALVLVAALLAGLYLYTRPSVSADAKTFTVIVTHSNGSTKDFTYTTDRELLGEYLYDQGLVIADPANPGMFHTVDGETASWEELHSYWAFYEGDDYANQGIETTPIADGAVYQLIYTVDG